MLQTYLLDMTVPSSVLDVVASSVADPPNAIPPRQNQPIKDSSLNAFVIFKESALMPILSSSRDVYMSVPFHVIFLRPRTGTECPSPSC